jgi:hypothetical protein
MTTPTQPAGFRLEHIFEFITARRYWRSVLVFWIHPFNAAELRT